MADRDGDTARPQKPGNSWPVTRELSTTLLANGNHVTPGEPSDAVMPIDGNRLLPSMRSQRAATPARRR